MSELTREDILQADDLEKEKVYLEPWDGHVYVREMTAEERDEFESDMVDVRQNGQGSETQMDTRNIRARMAALTVVDKDDNRLFSEDDIKRLGSKSSRAMNKIFNKAQKLSGFTDEDVEELAKNSGTARSDASDSDSQKK